MAVLRPDIGMVFSTFAFVSYCLLLISFPHFFTYRAGVFLSVMFLCLAQSGEMGMYIVKSQSTGLQRSFKIMNRAFPLLLLFGIASFLIPALNEKLYSLDPKAHSIHDGFFLIGGMIPVSDANHYMKAILTFLESGDTNGVVVYRPFPTIVSSVLFKLAGWDMVFFFHLLNIVVVLSVFFQGLVVSRHLGKGVALLNAWLLCAYFQNFQATFMTESLGGSFGMVGVALLFSGMYRGSLKDYAFGLSFTVIALVMRTGVVLLPLALVVLGVFRFRAMFRKVYASLAVLVAVFFLSAAAPGLQNRLLQKPVQQVSNMPAMLYQVLRNSDTWSVFEQRFPYKDSSGRFLTIGDRMKAAREVTMDSIRRDPMLFVGNYMKMLNRFSGRLVRYMHPWALSHPWLKAGPSFKYWVALLTLFFLLSFIRPAVYQTHSHLLFLFVPYLVLSFLMNPFLSQTANRVYAATVSINTTVASFAVWQLAALCRRFWFAARDFQIGEGQSRSSLDPASPVRPIRGWACRGWSAYPVLLMSLALAGPLIVDRTRVTQRLAPGYDTRWPSVPDAEIEVLNMSRSPFVLLDTADFSRITDPRVQPRRKWMHRWGGVSLTGGSTYWIAAVNQLDMGRQELYEHDLILPEAMLSGVPISRIDTLVVRRTAGRRTVEHGFFHDVTEILSVVYRY